jgi:glyoxylate carboligase
MPRMTAARAAEEILRREGVSYLFGLPGAAINPFYAAPATRQPGTASTTSRSPRGWAARRCACCTPTTSCPPSRRPRS